MDKIIKRCQTDHNYTTEDMAILEKELKRFFTMALIKKDSSTGMYSQDVDNLWHTFILFTKDYDLFCKKCFGYFLHHVPEDKSKTKTEQELAVARKDFQTFIKNYEEMFKEEIHPIWLLDLV